VDNATERQLELKETSFSGAVSLQITGRQARLEQLKPLVIPILEQQGLPRELVAVISVESSGIPTALSPKGARGVWQLMPDTARRYGLVVDGIRDDRLDIGRSTWAAARYLNDLHVQFGSWPLALAAYNTGEQNLQRAIEKGHSTDLPILSALGVLPLETRKYVPSVLAAWRAETGGSSAPDRQFLGGGAKVFALSGE
jgi:membrane-bound lytic murein transglycosylase D